MVHQPVVAAEEVEIPEGDGPLVVVAPSTSQDPECELVRVALEALADQPVRVLATTNRHRPEVPIEVPGNAVLMDWMPYRQVMPAADVVICHGGHGTVAGALAGYVHLRAQTPSMDAATATLAALVRQELQPVLDRLHRLEERTGAGED